jgi:hypothetical protein
VLARRSTAAGNRHSAAARGPRRWAALPCSAGPPPSLLRKRKAPHSFEAGRVLGDRPQAGGRRQLKPSRDQKSSARQHSGGQWPRAVSRLGVRCPPTGLPGGPGAGRGRVPLNRGRFPPFSRGQGPVEFEALRGPPSRRNEKPRLEGRGR